ncbi:MAG: hypothetical protein ISS88_00545 [Candidatus Portnoybacteria bacterium]|nr:hypothetical protein [Candidatus Portnoybacteria bacterium]
MKEKFEFPKLEKPQSEKEAKLQKIHEDVERITDNLGKPVEQEIKETVVMFKAFDLPTSDSCEGHSLEERKKEGAERRSSAPYVEVYPKEPEEENWQENDELRAQVEKESKEYRLKTVSLLNEFYKERRMSYDTMLGLEGIGYGFRVQSNGLEILEVLPEKEQIEKQRQYKQEMQDFTKFLKDKFLSE